MSSIENSNRYQNNQSSVASKQLQKSLNLNYFSQTSPYISNSNSKARSKSIKNGYQQNPKVTDNQGLQGQTNHKNLQSLLQEQFQNNIEKFNKYKYSMSDKKTPTSPGNHTSQNVYISSNSKGGQGCLLGLRSSQKNPPTNAQYRIMVKPNTSTNFYQKSSKKQETNKGISQLQMGSVGSSGVGMSSNGFNKADVSAKMKTEYNIYSDKLGKKIFDENNHFTNLTVGSTKRKNSSQIAFNTQVSQKDINAQSSFENNSFSHIFHSCTNSMYIPNSNQSNYPVNNLQTQSNAFYVNFNSSNMNNTSLTQPTEYQNINTSNTINASSHNMGQGSVYIDQNIDNIYSVTNSTNQIEDIPIHDSQIINSFTRYTNQTQNQGVGLQQNKPYLPTHSKQVSLNLAPNQSISQRAVNSSGSNQYPITQSAQQQQKNNSVYFKMDSQSNYNSASNTANHTHNHSSINSSNLLAVSQSHKNSSKNSQKHSFSGPSSTNQKLNSILKISVQSGGKSVMQPGSPNLSTQNAYINNKMNYKKSYNKQKNLSYGSKLLQNFLNTQNIDFNQSHHMKNPISTPNRMNNSEMGYRDKVNHILRGISNQTDSNQLQKQSNTLGNKTLNVSQRISHTMQTQMDTNPSPTQQENNAFVKTFSQPQLPPQYRINEVQQFSEHSQASKQISQDQQQELIDPYLKDLQYVKDYRQVLQNNEQFVANIKHPYFSFSQPVQVSQQQEDIKSNQVSMIKDTIDKYNEKPQQIQDWKQNMLQKLLLFQKNQTNSESNSCRDAKQVNTSSSYSGVQQQSDQAQDEYQLYKQKYLDFEQILNQPTNINQPKFNKSKEAGFQQNQLQNTLTLNQNFNLNKTNFLKRNKL